MATAIRVSGDEWVPTTITFRRGATYAAPRHLRLWRDGAETLPTRETPLEQQTEAQFRAHFDALVAQWWQDTEDSSSISEIVLHPAYQRIIGMGPDVVPLVLAELQRRPAQWFFALRAITGENPARGAERGDVMAVTDSWLRWARERGYLR